MSGFGPCPNGLCNHAALHHDIYTYDDPRPTCCVEGCNCSYRNRVLLSVSPASGPGGDRPTPTGQVTPNHNGDAG